MSTYISMPVKFHPKLLEISILNQHKIQSCYRDILGLQDTKHLSINIISPENEIVFLSSTPQTGINVCSSSLWHYDRSIHPDKFKKHSFYWWDECYYRTKYEILKEVKEESNGLGTGFVFVEQRDDFHILYSFASHRKDLDYRDFVLQERRYFVAMGTYAYRSVRDLYSQYSNGREAPYL